MTAPKIDTQAPERLRAFAQETKTTLNGVSEQIADDIIALLDLSAAREAAAWIAGRDALADAVLDTPISDIAVDEVLYAAKRLTPPTDTAALDRLIAERVRAGLTEYYGERCRDYEGTCPTCMAWDWFDSFAPAAAQGSKEGQS